MICNRSIVSVFALMSFLCCSGWPRSVFGGDQVRTSYTQILKSDTNLSERVQVLDLDADGFCEYRRTEIRRGTNVVLTVICHGKRTTRGYAIGAGYVFLESDADGDGFFEEVTILRNLVPIDSFRRAEDGQVCPMSTKELCQSQEDSRRATALAEGLADAAKAERESERRSKDDR